MRGGQSPRRHPRASQKSHSHEPPTSFWRWRVLHAPHPRHQRRDVARPWSCQSRQPQLAHSEPMSQEIAHRAGSADDVKILRRIQGVKRKTSITRPRWYRPSYFGSLRDTVSESRCGRRALSKDFLTSVRFASRREFANEMAASRPGCSGKPAMISS